RAVLELDEFDGPARNQAAGAPQDPQIMPFGVDLQVVDVFDAGFGAIAVERDDADLLGLGRDREPKACLEAFAPVKRAQLALLGPPEPVEGAILLVIAQTDLVPAHRLRQLL